MKTRAMKRNEETVAAKTRKRGEQKVGTETDSTTKESNHESQPYPNPYVCVYCGTPCSCLYRQLNKNSLSSIKAMHCDNCHRIVDPYIERELLLVLIDCILLRPEAYRHVLYNNQDLSCYVRFHNNSSNNKEPPATNANTASTSSATRVQRLVQWTLLSSLFHAYLKWQAFLHSQQHQQQARYGVSMPLTVIATAESSTLLHATFIVTSFLDLAAQWLAIYGFSKLLSAASSNNRSTISKSPSPSHNISYQLYLGLLLPTSFQIVCVLVLLWENSKTSTALGSLLIAFWQYLGISLVSIQNGSSSSTKIRVLKACMPAVGILSLMAWRFGVGRFLAKATDLQHLRGTIPCVGFEVDVFDLVGLVTNKDTSRSIEWVPLPLLLCLT